MKDTPLSEREIELLVLVATGASNKEISRKLYISINTVKVHLRNIFIKLEVASRTEAAMWAVQNGIVKTGGQGDRGAGSGEPDESDGAVRDGRGTSWFTRMPIRVRYWLLGAVAVLFVITGFGISQFARSVQEPDPTTEVISASEFEESRWKQLADMPTARAGLAAAAYDNQIYAIAGEGFDGVLAVNERYDPSSDTWETLAPKPLAVADVHAGVIGGKIFIPGGRLSNGDVTDSLEIYDPRSGEWSQGAPLPIPLSAYALATFEGKLYVFGGWDGEHYLDSVYMYDPAQDAWSERTPLPTARAFAGAATANEFIFVMGGKDENGEYNLNELYSPIADSIGEIPWVISVPIPDEWDANGMVSIAEKIYVISLNEENIVMIHEFASQNNEWRSIENSVISNLLNFESISLGSEIHILGGMVEKKYLKQNISYKVLYTISIPIVN